MKTSFVSTVFNEEETITPFLNSLANQTQKPDEIIIVDGGSIDKTVEKIKNFKLAPKPKVVIAREATIAQGRNRGIKNAKGEIVAMADAGCTLFSSWFEKITRPFKDKRIGIVGGFYKMTGKTIFQKCLAPYLGVLPEKLEPENFMPSARSMAFRKEIWEKVGGFNEKLDKGGEDTLFNYQAKKLGIKFYTTREALVFWEIPSSWGEAISKFYTYAKGDGQVGIWWHPSQRFSTHSLKISVIYLRYSAGLAFLILGFFNPFFWVFLGSLFVLYFFWSILKSYNYIKCWQAVFYLPAIQLVSDFCVMVGFASGSFKRR